MPSRRILERLERREAGVEELVSEILGKPGLLEEVVAGLESDEARVRYGCEKVLRALSETKPEMLYDKFDLFVDLLDSENTFLRCGAILTIANLATVDSRYKFEAIFDSYFAPISGPVLIPAANTIKGAARIAVAKPELGDRIARELLKVEKARYQTPECRNIAIGHAVESLDRFFDQIREKEVVAGFARRQLRNTRSATKKKAARFLKRVGEATGPTKTE